MKIVADENILAVDHWLEGTADLVLLPGRQISAADVRDADALLVRSITRVDESLLRNSSVTFVGTATSGTDHVDKAWLQRSGIHFADAAGCNANAVVEYVLAVFASLITNASWSPWDSRVAVVGAGHVGSALLRRLQSLGIECVACDPYVESLPGVEIVSLDQALQADVVCLHTPLTTEGLHPTFHMIDAARLNQMASHTILINAGRGEVIDNRALLSHLRDNPERKVILDVWESEPEPDIELLQLVYAGTPHIAGYSIEAKYAASRCILRQLCDHSGLPLPGMPGFSQLPPLVHDDRMQADRPGVTNLITDEQMFAEQLLRCFSPDRVTARFRKSYLKNAAKANDCGGAVAFEKVRKELVQRREFSANHLHATAFSPQVAVWLHACGFVLQA
jgi:erythronate-4-phosphate dehydrogenase